MFGFKTRKPAGMSAPSLFSLALLLCSSVAVHAQSVLDPSKLPSCAFQCQKLKSAQDACVPPTAAASSQNQYQACYCSSAQLTTLYSTPSGICDDVCSASDAQKIQSWYTSLCTDGIVVTPAASNPTSATASSSGTSSTANAGSAATPSSDSSSQTGSSSSSSNSGAPKSWIASHYGWIIFLIVLLVFLVGGIWLGLWLRRRRSRKATTKRFSNTNLPGPGGPGSTASPYDSGVLSPADASYMGSRNHPQMTMVPDAGSEAAFERYGGYASPASRGGAASPVPAGPKGSRTRVKPTRSYS